MEDDPLVQMITATFREIEAGDAPIIRSFLLKDRYYVGHCFRCGDLRAIVKHGSEVVEFVGADGQLLRAISLPKREKREAA